MMRDIKILFFGVFLLLEGLNGCSAQKELSKEEILTIWKESIHLKPIDKDSLMNSLISRVDISTNGYFSAIIDSLKEENIDTLCLFFIGSHGGLTSDSCITGSYLSTHFFWGKNNKYFSKKIVNHCITDIKKINQLPFFEYYENNYSVIKSEFFMPVIISVKYDSINSRLEQITQTNSIDVKYSVCIFVGENFKYFKLNSSDISNNESLFYDYNLKLKLYKLFELIKKQTNTL